jgi:uncharacterized SAM-binding protein YcdF (DUF218 family)
MIAFLLFIALQVADVWTTITGMNSGATEANPIMDKLFKKIGVVQGLVLAKSITVILFGLFLYETWIMWAFVCLYIIIVGNNVYQLRKL